MVAARTWKRYVNRERLAAAAAELLKAAQMDVDSASQQLLSSNLASLKESFDLNLNTLNQLITGLKRELDAKINTVNQNIASLKEELTKLNASITSQTKLQRLEWAIQNADIGTFGYNLYENKSSYPTRKNSKDLVRQILLWFRRDRGYFFGDGSIGDLNLGNYYNYVQEKERVDAENERMRADFRNALVEQIHALVGQKPRLEKKDGGRYCMYYQ